MPRTLLPLASAFLIALCILAAPARATPFVDLRAAWMITSNAGRPQPQGISISCYGDARSTSEVAGCEDTITLNLNPTAPTTATVTASGGLRVTNITDHALDGLAVFEMDDSPFNPGGPSFGLGIDNPVTQWAWFEGRVTAPRVRDELSCSVGFGGDSGFVNVARTRCGIGAPDSSLTDAWIDLTTLAPGASAVIPYTLSLTYTFAALPAPASAGLVVMGVITLTRLRRRVAPKAD